MKKICTVLYLLFSFAHLQAQTAGGYEFSVDSTTAYSAVTDGTSVLGCPATPTGDISTVVTLPSPFTFEGVQYSTIRVGYGGWISFGSNDPLASDANFATNIFSELANVPGAIAVCSKADYGTGGGSCTSEITTSSTTDEFIVQWQNIDDPEYSIYGLGNINFQLRLELNTGVIKMCYGGFSGGYGDGQEVGVGLRGNGLDFNTYVNSRAAELSSVGWKRSTRANGAGADCYLQVLPSGLTYIYTPANCFGAANLHAFEETGNSVKLEWNKTTSIDGYEYATLESGIPALPDSGTFVTDTFATVTGLSSTELQNAFIRGKCGTSYTTWVTVPFRTLCDPVTTPYKETYPYSSAIQISGAHLYFPCIGVDADNLASTSGNTQWEPSNVGEDGISLNNIGLNDTTSSWYFTKRVQMNAGTTYRIFFQAERSGFYITENTPFKVQMSNYPDTLSLISTPLINLTFTVPYDQTLDTFALFTPSVSGLYCAGFNTISSTALGEVTVLEVDVLENTTIPTSCTQNLTPADKETVTAQAFFNYTWNEVPNAQQYTVHVTHTLFPFYAEKNITNGESDTTYETSYYNPNDTIKWYVVPRFFGTDATGCATDTTVFYVESSTMPLTLLSFTGELQKNIVALQWQTADEVNTSHFEIERSNDATNFAAIGNINAAGNSSAMRKYSFTDANPPGGENYYRLKMIDKNGKFTYSNIVSVNINFVNTPLVVFPNPASGILNIQIPSTDGTIDMKISDAAGKIVSHRTVLVNGSSSKISISNLSKGLYYLTVTTNGKTQTVSFVKQ